MRRSIAGSCRRAARRWRPAWLERLAARAACRPRRPWCRLGDGDAPPAAQRPPPLGRSHGGSGAGTTRSSSAYSWPRPPLPGLRTGAPPASPTRPRLRPHTRCCPSTRASRGGWQPWRRCRRPAGPSPRATSGSTPHPRRRRRPGPTRANNAREATSPRRAGPAAAARGSRPRGSIRDAWWRSRRAPTCPPARGTSPPAAAATIAAPTSLPPPPPSRDANHPWHRRRRRTLGQRRLPPRSQRSSALPHSPQSLFHEMRRFGLAPLG
mmetsp:Transcript_16133/g.41220  ORF Transcript_16133/g.41220 Transcript_16133/m.41220 type:complete len:266 (-) Transcript_16133:74-871(-)